MNRLKITNLPIEELKPYAGNAKKHPVKQVKQIMESIRRFGMCDPIAIWGDENVVVEGHGRLAALKKLGYDTVPTFRLDHLSDEERRAYTLAHNQLTLNTGYDDVMLNAELDVIDMDMTVFGFEAKRDDEVYDDDFDGNTPRETLTQRGDIWILGRHKLMCGDASEAEDMDALLDSAPVDMLLTDIPTNIGDEQSLSETLNRAFANADANMKPGAVFYIFHPDALSLTTRGACRCVGWDVRQCLIWNHGESDARTDGYAPQHMPILYGWKDGTHLWASNRKQTTVLNYAKPRIVRGCTSVPVMLVDYLMQNNTKGGDTVLDMFAGTGTALIAAEQNGRTCCAVESCEQLVDYAVFRYINLVGRTDCVRIVRNGTEVPLKSLDRRVAYD